MHNILLSTLSLLCYCFVLVAAPASLAPNWTKKSLFSSVLLKLSQLEDNSYVGLLNALDGSFSQKSWGSHSATFSFKRSCIWGKSSKTQKIDFWKSNKCHNETSRNESSFSQYLPLFWPVWQLRATVGAAKVIARKWAQNLPVHWQLSDLSQMGRKK